MGLTIDQVGKYAKALGPILEFAAGLYGSQQNRKLQDKLIEAQEPKDRATTQIPYGNEYIARIFPTLLKEALSGYQSQMRGYGGTPGDFGPLFQLLGGIDPNYSGIGQPGYPQMLGAPVGPGFNPFSDKYGSYTLSDLVTGRLPVSPNLVDPSAPTAAPTSPVGPQNPDSVVDNRSDDFYSRDNYRDFISKLEDQYNSQTKTTIGQNGLGAEGDPFIGALIGWAMKKWGGGGSASPSSPLGPTLSGNVYA